MSQESQSSHSSQSSGLSSLLPYSPRSLLRYTSEQVRIASRALEAVGEIPGDSEEVGEAAAELGKSMTQIRKGLKAAQKPSQETLAAMGDPHFFEKVLEMYQRPRLPVPEWFGYALDKTKATLSEDASLGFYVMARGIESMPLEELASIDSCISDILCADLEDRLMQSIDRTPVAELGAEQLWKIYNTMDPGNPRNKKHRVELFQHMIQCIENIRFILGWIALVKSGNANDRKAAVEAVYAIECAKQDPPIQPDTKSDGFKTFVGQFKNFRTGARHVHDAYEVFGSIVLICPLMHINAFHESRVGVSINNVVKALKGVDPLPGVDFETREQSHHQVLKVIVGVFEGLVGAEYLSDMLNDMESEYLNGN
ncbi:hypothetical protein FRC11_005229 [Ceratobasidium sp. 423]|nr:hypothetical protein FRC11_005229 [Ceratobasidium sp. 423]